MVPTCVYCIQRVNPAEAVRSVIKFGSFVRKNDGEVVARFRCRDCGKTFSSTTRSRCYKQKKRHLNPQIYIQLVSGTSQRRIARMLRINLKTVVRKFILLGLHAKEILDELNKTHSPSLKVEFDDLETFEHSKCKPLSVTMMVEHKSRRILNYRVARMPAKGLLAAISRQKYGIRKDERPAARKSLFQELQPHICESALIKSDMNPSYVNDVKRHFPKARHQVFKGRRGCVVGQGELKAIGFDPIFSLNHTFAMLRANINRLFRRTWNTTKKPECLDLHIALYVLYHNLVLIRR